MPYADPADYRFYQRGYQRAWMLARQRRWRAAGACVECGEPLAVVAGTRRPQFTRCFRHRRQKAAANRAYRLRQRASGRILGAP